MVADGVITREQHEVALSYIQRTGERIEEALLEINALDEASLLKYLAAHYKTRFVSTEKLARKRTSTGRPWKKFRKSSPSAIWSFRFSTTRRRARSAS